jgi:hypothetical protein
MTKRFIAEYTRDEFDALRKRLEHARDTLRAGNCRLQSVARAYYIVFVTASFAAKTYDVRATHWRDRKRVTNQDFRHNDLPDVVYALYCGGKRGNISDPGGSPGIGSGNYKEHEAYRNADALYQMRILADYGPTTVPEPYTAAEAEMLMETANKLTEDLERLL